MASLQPSRSVSAIYTPLNKSQRSIRLLQFTDPPPGSVPYLHFTLAVHKLPTGDGQTHNQEQQESRFIALSYVWGQEVADQPIVVNGQHLRIRANLHALLQVLHAKIQAARRSERFAPRGSLFQFLRGSPLFWADAICIDQESFDEKNHQVNMMGDIYLKAEYVFTWLGPAADDSMLAMRWLRKKGFRWSPEPSIEPHVLDSLIALLNRPYWQRLWIVQEFALAIRPILLCGQVLVSLYGARGEKRLETMQNFTEEAVKTAAWPILSTRDTWGQFPDFHCLAVNFWRQKCEKRQDRIFALLALYEQKLQRDTFRITADYKATPEQLFYRVLAECTGDCTGQQAVEEMQKLLDVEHCEIEGYFTSAEFVDKISGIRNPGNLSRVYNDEQRVRDKDQSSNVSILSELPHRGITRQNSIQDIFGYLESLTGLAREDMKKDPEGAFLEVFGHLYHYYKATIVDTRNRRHADAWETFVFVLRHTLGVHVVGPDRYCQFKKIPSRWELSHLERQRT